MLFYVVYCYVEFCYVMLCYFMLCYVTFSFVMLCYVELLPRALIVGQGSCFRSGQRARIAKKKTTEGF